MNHHSEDQNLRPVSENPNTGVVGLAAGTLVTTPDGEKKIEDVVAGELVLSGVGDGEVRFYKVEKVTANTYTGPMLRVMAGSGHQFRPTPNHICFATTFKRGASFIERFLTILYRQNMSKLPVQIGFFENYTGEDIRHSVVTINKNDEQIHNDYDRAEEAARRMAQANGGVEITRFARFVALSNPNPESEVPFTFPSAISLKNGLDIPVVKNGRIKEAIITNITTEPYDGLVYALDVPVSRNFAANGVLVHDSTSLAV